MTTISNQNPQQTAKDSLSLGTSFSSKRVGFMTEIRRKDRMSIFRQRRLNQQPQLFSPKESNEVKFEHLNNYPQKQALIQLIEQIDNIDYHSVNLNQIKALVFSDNM